MENMIDLKAWQSQHDERPRQKKSDQSEVVALQHIDLDTVVETVRVLRLLDDKSLLDKHNQRRT